MHYQVLNKWICCREEAGRNDQVLIQAADLHNILKGLWLGYTCKRRCRAGADLREHHPLTSKDFEAMVLPASGQRRIWFRGYPGRLAPEQTDSTPGASNKELLDKSALCGVTTDKLKEALAALIHPPALIITDSQVFRTVYDKKPKESKLTSFSVLMAGYKGDLTYFVESAYAIEGLTENSRVLIAESCTHAPMEEDIGRVKIPAMLRKRAGQGLKTEVVSGADFPEDLSGYDLIIHCGACMFNRKHVLSRVEKARAAGVPMTNYGVTIAYLSGILDKISLNQ